MAIRTEWHTADGQTVWIQEPNLKKETFDLWMANTPPDGERRFVFPVKANFEAGICAIVNGIKYITLMPGEVSHEEVTRGGYNSKKSLIYRYFK